MRKVSSIVVYRNSNDDIGYYIDNVTVITRNGEHITLFSREWDIMDLKHPYLHNNFRSMYKSVLQTLKNNDFYCSYYKDFSSKWYDIVWIEESNPTHLEKFGYRCDIID